MSGIDRIESLLSKGNVYRLEFVVIDGTFLTEYRVKLYDTMSLHQHQTPLVMAKGYTALAALEEAERTFVDKFERGTPA